MGSYKFNKNKFNKKIPAGGKMKLTMIFGMALILCSIKGHADESYAVNTYQYNDPYNYLVINSSPINQLLSVHELIIASNDGQQIVEVPAQITGKFHSQLLSIEAGIMQSGQESNWSKYYFQGALTIHQYDKFNLSLMANIEQLNNVHSLYVLSNKNQTPYVESLTMSNETELNYSYGLVGRYSVNSTWQFSGGIIHAQAINESNSNVWYGNTNMALIGTTYSF